MKGRTSKSEENNNILGEFSPKISVTKVIELFLKKKNINVFFANSRILKVHYRPAGEAWGMVGGRGGGEVHGCVPDCCSTSDTQRSGTERALVHILNGTHGCLTLDACASLYSCAYTIYEELMPTNFTKINDFTLGMCRAALCRGAAKLSFTGRHVVNPMAHESRMFFCAFFLLLLCRLNCDSLFD